MTEPHHRPVALRCEYLANPLGLDELKPRLSWRMEDARQGARQTAYRILAATSPEALGTGKPDLWDSGNVKSDQSLDVVYGGKRLSSRMAVWWCVCIWDQAGQPSEWSEPACFEMGLLKRADWTAQWVGRPIESREGSQPCPLLRTTFEINGEVVNARLYVTARGLFECHLNGERIGSDFFTPGWTDYNKRIPYLVYDVTRQVRKGSNMLGAILGDGWYAGYLVWKSNHFVYGDQLSLLAQLEVEQADGTKIVVASGPDWKTVLSPIVKSDIYHGETYDARLERPDWCLPGADDSGWGPVSVYSPPSAPLVARRNGPVRRQQELPVVAQTEPSFGVHVFDLGQNMVGWARIKVRAPAGTLVKIRFAEMLNSDGTLYTENLRSARCTDHYLCKGGGEDVYEPRFTFHGFRYVELTGLCQKPEPGDVTGVVLHSDIPATGSFECSHPLVNQLQSNIVWGQRGNFLEVPTDCPQRDERLGWTGDAQVFIRTAAFNRDVSAFFTKWCADMEDSQHADGAFPHVAPDVIRDGGRGCAAWADAGVICPWTVYLCYGDTRILERHYESMKRWIEWRRTNSPDGICTSACFGDWLSLDVYEGGKSYPLTPPEVIATAYHAHTTNLFSRIAGILERKDDARKYAALFRKIKAAFNREFVTPGGRMAVSQTQTAYLLALGFDLLPASKRAAATKHLVNAIEAKKTHLSTGFVGTPLLAPVLTQQGRLDLAYKLLLQKTFPSWLFPILQGATTMWERWNSFTKEYGFGDKGMNSFNHYAYGAIGEWLYNTVAGIELDPAEPGYKHIILRPQPPLPAGAGTTEGDEETITWARSELTTRYGKVASHWKVEGGKLKVSVTVPSNTRATVILPGGKPRKVGAGVWTIEAPFKSYASTIKGRKTG